MLTFTTTKTQDEIKTIFNVYAKTQKWMKSFRLIGEPMIRYQDDRFANIGWICQAEVVDTDNVHIMTCFYYNEFDDTICFLDTTPDVWKSRKHPIFRYTNNKAITFYCKPKPTTFSLHCESNGESFDLDRMRDVFEKYLPVSFDKIESVYPAIHRGYAAYTVIARHERTKRKAYFMIYADVMNRYDANSILPLSRYSYTKVIKTPIIGKAYLMFRKNKSIPQRTYMFASMFTGNSFRYIPFANADFDILPR